MSFKDIHEFIFDYVKSKFDEFVHQNPTALQDGNWVIKHKYGTSWGPLIQWAFIKKGFDLGYVVREDHTYPHLHDVARDFDNFKLNDLPYGDKKPNGRKNKYPNFKTIDVCWGRNDNCFDSPEDLILALEYEEMDKTKAFSQDLESLSSTNSKLRVIIVRLFFPDNSDGMILEKLKQTLDEKYQNKNFGFIFIYPLNTSRIIFESYEWNQNKLQKIGYNFFEIKSNENFMIKKLN